jgi:carbon storage regulator CsrA
MLKLFLLNTYIKVRIIIVIVKLIKRIKIMLVLSRKAEESIIINTPDQKEIKITIIKIENKKVKVGISAGTEFTILREELTLGN